jgi:signal transduction histidine kinase
MSNYQENGSGPLPAEAGTVTQLFQIASHDLKSPLSNLRMAEHLLRERLESDPESIHILDMIRLTLDNMQIVIHDLLEVIELQSRHVAISLKPVSLHDVLITVFSQYEYPARSKQIEFSLNCDNRLVMADEKRLTQILSNFVSNAIKYSPHGSRITLTSISQHDRVRIVVADEGPGISEAERTQLFTEFGRLSSRPTGTETCTGLGLWIVWQLAVVMNGRVGADFPDEGGSHFWVELPAHQQQT